MKKKFLLYIGAALYLLFYLGMAGAQTNVETPKESEVIGYLQKGLVVFLCFHNAQEPNLYKVKAEIESVTLNFKGAIEPVYVNGDDKKEDVFREKFKVLSTQTVVFIVVPPGRVIAQIEGEEITKTNLMKILYSSCGGGGCGSGGCGSR